MRGLSGFDDQSGVANPVGTTRVLSTIPDTRKSGKRTNTHRVGTEDGRDVTLIASIVEAEVKVGNGSPNRNLDPGERGDDDREPSVLAANSVGVGFHPLLDKELATRIVKHHFVERDSSVQYNLGGSGRGGGCHGMKGTRGIGVGRGVGECQDDAGGSVLGVQSCDLGLERAGCGICVVVIDQLDLEVGRGKDREDTDGSTAGSVDGVRDDNVADPLRGGTPLERGGRSGERRVEVVGGHDALGHVALGRVSVHHAVDKEADKGVCRRPWVADKPDRHVRLWVKHPDPVPRVVEKHLRVGRRGDGRELGPERSARHPAQPQARRGGGCALDESQPEERVLGRDGECVQVQV